jgi:hypothetical protein
VTDTVRTSASGCAVEGQVMAGSWWPRAAASQRRSPQEVGPSVGQLWRSSDDGIGSSATGGDVAPAGSFVADGPRSGPSARYAALARPSAPPAGRLLPAMKERRTFARPRRARQTPRRRSQRQRQGHDRLPWQRQTASAHVLLYDGHDSRELVRQPHWPFAPTTPRFAGTRRVWRCGGRSARSSPRSASCQLGIRSPRMRM